MSKDKTSFVEQFKSFDTNYMVLWPGFFKYYIRRRISVAYVDINAKYLETNPTPEDLYLGLENLKQYISYRSMIVLSPGAKIVDKYTDKYNIIILDIARKDLQKFEDSVRFLINSEFNKRNTSYFLILLEMFNFLDKAKTVKFKENIENQKNIEKIKLKEYYLDKES